MLLKRTLSGKVKGRKVASLLMKHIEAERNKLLSAPPDTHPSSTKTFHTERGQYTLVMSYGPGESGIPTRNSTIGQEFPSKFLGTLVCYLLSEELLVALDSVDSAAQQ